MEWMWFVVANTLVYAGSAEMTTQQTTTPGLGWWGEWKNWGNCTGVCEWGVRQRYRECLTDYCLGEETQSGVCDIYMYCSEGDWSVWGAYEPDSECDRFCGGGQMLARRERECLNDGANATCEGIAENYTQIECNTQSCFLHGEWSDWREWTDSACSTTCDYGIITKVSLRTCTNPQPAGGGGNCEGDNWKSYTLTCHNDITCEMTMIESITTTELMWINPTMPITISVLAGVPSLFALICIIRAVKHAYGKRKEANAGKFNGFSTGQQKIR